MQVYRITNKINGKSYVGQTTYSVSKRNNSFEAFSKNKKLRRAIDRDGIENFELVIIRDDIENLDELNRLTSYYADTLNTYYPFGYNLKPCGKNKTRSLKVTSVWVEQSPQTKVWIAWYMAKHKRCILDYFHDEKEARAAAEKIKFGYHRKLPSPKPHPPGFYSLVDPLEGYNRFEWPDAKMESGVDKWVVSNSF